MPGPPPAGSPAPPGRPGGTAPSAEVGGPDQIRSLPQLHRPGALQQRGRKLGTEVVVFPGHGVVEVTGHRPQQIVVVAVFLRIHPVNLAAQPLIDRKGDAQCIETAGNLLSLGLDLQTYLLHHQPRREGEARILPREAVKGAVGAVQADGGVGVAVIGGQMNQPGKPGPRAGQQNINALFRTQSVLHKYLPLSSGSSISDRP